MRFTFEIPDELIGTKPATVPSASVVDTPTPAHYAGVDAQSAGAAPNMGGGVALGLVSGHDALSAGPAEELAVDAAVDDANVATNDGGAANH